MAERVSREAGMSWTVIVPVKRLAVAKSRLRGATASAASEQEAGAAHEALVLAMALDTIAAALASPVVGRVVLVTADAIAREQSQRLSELLAELPESQADAVRLRFHGGLTFPEIAAALGCSLTSAKNWVRSGLLGIAEHLPPDERSSVSSRTLGETP